MGRTQGGELTAVRFEGQIKARATAEQREKILRYFKTGPGEYAEGDVFIGVPMGEIFTLAKAYLDMPVGELETLLESDIHEVRVGALSVMDKAARRKKTPEPRREELYALYLRRHDRINNWDLVDLAAPHVIGGYLFDKPRGVLYELARSENVWERRTGIVSTAYFIRQDDVTDTFAIAELLLGDDHDLIHKAAGAWMREAGKREPERLLRFLDEHAPAMPRTMLRYAIERLDKDQRAHYRGMKTG